MIFITHNPNHAFPVGDRFLILNRGQSMGSFAKDEIKSAPAPDKGHAAPSPSEREQVFSHFGMTDPGPPPPFS